jgi:hypothetical protein
MRGLRLRTLPTLPSVSAPAVGCGAARHAPRPPPPPQTYFFLLKAANLAFYQSRTLVLGSATAGTGPGVLAAGPGQEDVSARAALKVCLT